MVCSLPSIPFPSFPSFLLFYYCLFVCVGVQMCSRIVVREKDRVRNLFSFLPTIIHFIPTSPSVHHPQAHTHAHMPFPSILPSPPSHAFIATILIILPSLSHTLSFFDRLVPSPSLLFFSFFNFHSFITSHISHFLFHFTLSGRQAARQKTTTTTTAYTSHSWATPLSVQASSATRSNTHPPPKEASWSVVTPTMDPTTTNNTILHRPTHVQVLLADYKVFLPHLLPTSAPDSVVHTLDSLSSLSGYCR